MSALALWCFRHRRIVVATWLVVLVCVVGGERVIGNAYSNNFGLPGTAVSPAAFSSVP